MQWYIKVLKNYVNFSGRAHRTEFWMFTLINILISIALGFLVNLIAFGKPNSPLSFLETIYSLALLLPTLAVTVRRLHDTERSGLWLVPQYIAIPVFIIIGIMTALSPSSQQNIASLMGLLVTALTFLGIYSIVIFIFLVLPGTDGPNRFGDDPWEDYYDEDEYDDEYYDDYDDGYNERYDDNRAQSSPPPHRYAREQPRRYEQEPPPRRSSGRPQEDRSQVRRYNNPEQSPRAPQKDVYDLNESFREPPPQNQRTDRPTRSPSKPIPENPLSDYKNPFSSGPTDQEKKQFDRFGLVDDDFGFDDDTSQRTPSRKPPADKDR